MSKGRAYSQKELESDFYLHSQSNSRYKKTIILSLQVLKKNNFSGDCKISKGLPHKLLLKSIFRESITGRRKINLRYMRNKDV